MNISTPISHLLEPTSHNKHLTNYRPLIFDITQKDDQEAIIALIDDKKPIIHDEIFAQLRELVENRFPKESLSAQEISFRIAQVLEGKTIKEYGNWMYYPWSNKLVHLLPESAFYEIRTSRNCYKITPPEQAILAQKKVGIVGLSVGQSVALTMAMERSLGEIRLADFDHIDISNLNRIRTPLHHIGVNKAIVTAREIAEIDPYIKVKCFLNGITEQNMEAFFLEGGALDLLIEECDSLDMKVRVREEAKKLRIPVVMDTSDRGMLDVERFDLEPDRPIFHGKIEGLNTNMLKGLTNAQKVPFMLKMMGISTLSTRGKASLLELNQSIKTWPQLATSVILGGALAGDVSRRILLDQFHDSGRYYIDLQELIADQKVATKASIPTNPYTGWKELISQEIQQISLDKYTGRVTLTNELCEQLLQAAILAPSGGNAQPWHWFSHQNCLFLTYDGDTLGTFLDFDQMGSQIALGAASENIILKAQEIGLSVLVEEQKASNQFPIFLFSFYSLAAKHKATEKHPYPQLVQTIPLRLTNRLLGERITIETRKIDYLQELIASIPQARLAITQTPKILDQLAQTVAQAERVRYLHPHGHSDLFDEIRWTAEESEQSKTGIDLRTMEMSNGDIAGLRVAQNWEVIKHLKAWNGGSGFDQLMHKTIDAAAAVACIFMPTNASFWQGGRAVQRLWLAANQQDISFQPITPITFLFNRLILGEGAELDPQEKKQLENALQAFQHTFPFSYEQEKPIFLFRLSIATNPTIKSYRRNLTEVYTQL